MRLSFLDSENILQRDEPKYSLRIARGALWIMFLWMVIYASGAQAADRPLAVSVTTLGNGASPTNIGSGVLREQSSIDLKATATGQPNEEPAYIPGIQTGLWFEWSIGKKEYRPTEAAEWQIENSGNVKVTAAGEGDLSNVADVGVSFDKPGFYRVTVKAIGNWWLGSGDMYTGSGEHLLLYSIPTLIYDPDAEAHPLTVTFMAPDKSDNYDFNNLANIKAFPGDRIIFGLEITDQDRRKSSPTANWISIPPYILAGTGDYEVQWSITGATGAADFNSAFSNITQTKTYDFKSGNLDVFIRPTWNGNPITVTATAIDKAPDPEAGTTTTRRDPSLTKTWTLVSGGAKPTTVTAVDTHGNAANDFHNVQRLIVTYETGPDIDAAGHPDYENNLILESFGQSAPAGFDWNDVDSVWKQRHQQITTAEGVAIYAFGVTGSNSSFILDAQDRFSDGHTNVFWPLTNIENPFKPSAFDDADGVGWSQAQTYSCGGMALKTYTITRRLRKVGTAYVMEISKTGP